MLSLTPKELSQILEKSPQTLNLIDVRGTGEYEEAHIPEAKNIPLHLLPMKMNEINRKKKVVFICRSGGRSSQATMFAEKDGITGYNLAGGMMNFEREFPKRVVHGPKKKLFGLF